MVCHNKGCLGKYDFDQIAMYARKRFVEGIDTVSLMSQASSETEKEEIALVCLLSVDDDVVKDIELHCRYSGTCKLTNCQSKLRQIINTELADELQTSDFQYHN